MAAFVNFAEQGFYQRRNWIDLTDEIVNGRHIVHSFDYVPIIKR